ncbi:PUA-PAPS reductase like fusion [Desulfosporosinus sp. I2]|uniref:phosphoadenosine phosphosulfate reductase domain-containing protein n=1 Tax=Desulfosporosinus sp. I2 TaxID=1617025 RepID=UPI0005EEEAC3|nr:phosphoadenosine phosphosulfate reductase family protein [Desulfosporosinus sp. I2]KJR47496.1 PUA-PAPS reductase like fusion [Desulfosporosinus sp. I2]
MYGYEWTEDYGIFRLSINSKVEKEIRPVFKEELDFFGLDAYWHYPDTTAPLLWAEGIRRYMLNGDCVAEAKGGGFYSKPQVKVYKNGLKLQEIDIDVLYKTNEVTMKGLEQKAISFIREMYEEYKKKGYAFAVAFSGGKDSLILLDLVSNALSPDEFYVIFSNTGMELESTILSVERAKKHWNNLNFYEAECHLSPIQTWDEFGFPGRRMRWCCAVHKSAPTILKLREITQNYDVQAVVFDGVRSEESVARSQYAEVSVGAKNINQVNCSPILKWGTAEVYTYLLKHEILFNDAYRIGLFRVGCKICPMSSSWWDGIANSKYPLEMEDLFQKIEKYAENTKPAKERKQFIEEGGWKARMGGRGLPNGGNRIIETISGDNLIFQFTQTKQQWLAVAPILGSIIEKFENTGVQLIDRQEFAFTIEEKEGLTVSYAPFSRMNRYVLSHLRGVANKVAFCVGCKACMVQCSFGAFVIKDDGAIYIREDKCKHCNNCILFTRGKGCLVAKSLSTTQGGNTMDLKGMNRYQHFGFRKGWLEHYFQNKGDCFTMGQLGTRQYDALKVWVKESGLMTAANKGEKSGSPTALCEKLEPIGPFNPFTWAVIWANLAYHSTIVKWYMLKVPAGETYEKSDLVFMLGDDYSPSTRDNAVTALLETLRHSPIGANLKQGIPVTVGKSYKFIKQGWETPDAIAILYALYLWAEATGRYTLTLAQLEQARENDASIGMDPVVIFGLNPAAFKDILQELALHYDKYIRVSFVADLDNVRLFPEISSLDIIDIVAE